MKVLDACRFAKVDRDRLNEAIAAGLYSHAPKTIPGKTRTFAVNDLVALRVFAELIRAGYKQEFANKITGKVMKHGSAAFYDRGEKVFEIKFDVPRLLTEAQTAINDNRARVRNPLPSSGVAAAA